MTKTITIILGLSLTTLLVASCNNNSEAEARKSAVEIFTKVYAPNNLNTQSFTIDNSIDNLIKGIHGTIIRINRNTFIDQYGKAITGKVEVKLIEAIRPIDRVLGNLTTTFNGQTLESGGMIYLDASADNKAVTIAEGRSISIKMPTNSKLAGMSLFEGKQDSTGITWQNPMALPIGDTTEVISEVLFEKTTNMTYWVDGFDRKEDFPELVDNEVSRIAWAGDGLKITKDSVFKIDKYTVRFYKEKKLKTWTETFSNRLGHNTYNEDSNISYIFSIKKLGWANIDRLLDDPRTKEVELITAIKNENDFKFIYVTMVTKRMYLPGYQRKDKTFSFAHDDEEKLQLPIGETATIIATAYKANVPYFAIKKITISEEQSLSFTLEATTVDYLKVKLLDAL